MARFGSLGTQYFDNDGKPLSGGKISFFQSGTNTPLTTYSNPTYVTANANPVILDASGRQPNIFFPGVAKASLFTSADVLVETRDPVGIETVPGPFSEWSASQEYSIYEIAQGSDGNYYQSAENTNINNDPTTSLTEWQRVGLVATEWNPDFPYQLGDLAIDQESIYQCVVALSINGAPSPTSTDWALLGGLLYDATITSYVEGVVVTTTNALTLNARLGTIWQWTLSSAASLTLSNFDVGRNVTLVIDAGANSVNWAAAGITWMGGSAPTLAPSGKTHVILFRTNAAIYGALIGFSA
jgi:hypothetical protein